MPLRIKLIPRDAHHDLVVVAPARVARPRFLRLLAVTLSMLVVACVDNGGTAELDPSFALAPGDLTGPWTSHEPQRIDNDESGGGVPGCAWAAFRLTQLERDAGLKVQQIVARIAVDDRVGCMAAYRESLADGKQTLPSFGVGDEDQLFAARDRAGRTTLISLIRVGDIVSELRFWFDPDLREARAIAATAAEKIRAALEAARQET